jgi:hypothetical protein
MRKKKVVAVPLITSMILWDRKYLFELVKELKGFLQSRLNKWTDGVTYCCSSKRNSYDGCWKRTEQFCKKKGLDPETFIRIFQEDTEEAFPCESEIANALDLEDLPRKLGINSNKTLGKEH